MAAVSFLQDSIPGPLSQVGMGTEKSDHKGRSNMAGGWSRGYSLHFIPPGPPFLIPLDPFCSSFRSQGKRSPQIPHCVGGWCRMRGALHLPPKDILQQEP